MAFFIDNGLDLLRLPCNKFEKLSPLQGFHEWNVIINQTLS